VKIFTAQGPSAPVSGAPCPVGQGALPLIPGHLAPCVRAPCPTYRGGLSDNCDTVWMRVDSRSGIEVVSGV